MQLGSRGDTNDPCRHDGEHGRQDRDGEDGADGILSYRKGVVLRTVVLLRTAV